MCTRRIGILPQLSTIPSSFPCFSWVERSATFFRQPIIYYPTIRMQHMSFASSSIFWASSLSLLDAFHQGFGIHSHAVRAKRSSLGLLYVMLSESYLFIFCCQKRSKRAIYVANNPPQVDLGAQLLAAIFILFVKSFQSSKMRPLRGLVFSILASSAFYPIIIKIFQIGWSRANIEYGASLYALTILIYLCSMTIYAV